MELIDLLTWLKFFSNDLIQMVNFPTRIPDCDSHSPALLDLFISSDASICSTMAFPPLGNSDHVVVSVSIDFPINSKQDALFHCIAYDYSCADWDGLCDHLTDVPQENKVLARKLKLMTFSRNWENRIVFTKARHHDWQQEKSFC